jgi:altronate hydrolase
MSEDATFPILSQPASGSPGLAGRRRLEDVALLLSAEDNVAVAREDFARGLELIHEGPPVVLRDPVPAGHKFAVREIPQGSPVTKYAHEIGNALYPIQPGEWVHIHNVQVEHDLESREYPACRPAPIEFPAGLPRTFRGYRRADGRVGTRNYIAVLAASNCASHVCARIAEELAGTRGEGLDGIVALPHQDGCGAHDGPDLDQLERTLKGIILNPNVAAVLMIGLGCEINHLARYSGWGAGLGDLKPFAGMEIQSSGGTSGAITEGKRRLDAIVEAVRSLRRTEEPVSRIVLGLNCGGSDAFSGITANPALGRASDLLVAAGGTAVLAETPEIYGAEQSLARRAIDRETGMRLIQVVSRYKDYAAKFGATMDSNPSPGNRRGGITNIVEKSLAAVMKGGSSPLVQVLDFAEQVSRSGLVFMDTPGYDPVSLTGIAAGGCNVIAFTTGRGSAIGSPIGPVLKIASNSRTYLAMRDDMDVNAGEILDGKAGIREKGEEIYRRLMEMASGAPSRSQILGHHEFAPWRIGPVM